MDAAPAGPDDLRPATDDDAASGREGGPATTAGTRRPNRRWYRLALAVTVLLVAVVVLTVPVAMRSMVSELSGRKEDALYDLRTRHTVAADAAAPDDATFVNIAVVALDAAQGSATLAVSGHRVCPAVCP